MRRPLLLGTVWTASAATSIGLGFLAVSLVGASASSGTLPVVATGSTSAGSSAGPAPGAAASPAAAAQQVTAGGTVFADCGGGQPVVAGVPVEGWSADDSNDPSKVEFRNGTQSVEVRAVCADGSPQFTVEGARADDRLGGDGSAGPATSSPAAPSADDSSGRAGGGHGADDPAGDDSSGRAGGGPRADDPAGDDSSGRVGGGQGADDPAGDDSSGRAGGG